MSQLGKIFRKIQQTPVIWAWRLAIYLAPKKTHHGIVLCDVSSNQSIYGERFAADVIYAVNKVAESSPKLFGRIQRFISCIGRAGIQNDFEYFPTAKLLLIRVDYGQKGLLRRELIMTELIQAATLAYLHRRDGGGVTDNTRVDRILAKQRMRIFG
jgi:hypothetical protein